MASVAPPGVPSASAADYAALCKKLKDATTLQGISGLLSWDELVMLPPSSAAAKLRSAQSEARIPSDPKLDPPLPMAP